MYPDNLKNSSFFDRFKKLIRKVKNHLFLKQQKNDPCKNCDGQPCCSSMPYCPKKKNTI